MKVRDVMTTEVGYCQPDAPLAQAADIMWQRDCGVVPVVDESQRVIGMITDRDICFAVVTKNRLASEIKISEVISQNEVRSCAPGDAVEDALKTMKRRQLRRLPVVNKDGVLVGILSLADLISGVGKGKDAVPRKKLLAALREISHLRPITLHALSDSDEDENESEKAGNEENYEDEDDSDDDSNSDDSDDEDDDDDDSEDDDEDESDRQDDSENDSGSDEEDEEKG
ncbi:MAG TPA: CBS domain-containing protein [Pyrinomonadaceae bacterium]